MDKITIALLLLIHSTVIFGQADGDGAPAAPAATVDSIPFVLTEHNNISVRALLNQVDTVNLMLHTAANSVTLIEAATQRLQSIQTNGVDTVNSWGGDQSSKYSTDNALQIGHQARDGLTIWENKNSGPGTDGKFGLNFFGDQIVEINFEERYLKVYSTLTEEQILNRGYEKFTLLEENDCFFIEAVSQVKGEPIRNKFLIHSGFGGAILFDDATANQFGFTKHLAIIAESELQDSYGNVLKTKKAILPQFSIANQQLTNVPIGFFEGSIGRQKMSVIGGEILKRFNIIFDTQHSSIFLRANELTQSPLFR
ncbi:MAG: hypothetical protein AAF146_03240 [Bacteroidota bacterium]